MRNPSLANGLFDDLSESTLARSEAFQDYVKSFTSGN